MTVQTSRKPLVDVLDVQLWVSMLGGMYMVIGLQMIAPIPPLMPLCWMAIAVGIQVGSNLIARKRKGKK
ncbi:hypothetical protein [Cryobacterium melibiosiphilum]|uniref:hypothetical protein n=1 Tax=Cryobacterium melibiosiphilum TaxID=995039 RepID=UPI0011C21BEE|nr:hypothetical protein [Cryobacterium melibiosiphilum]